MATTVHLGQYTNLVLNEFYTFLKQKHYCHSFKENSCEMRKSITSIGAHTHTHVQGTSTTAHIKADRLCTILWKLSSNQFLLILSVCSYLQQLPMTAQHLTYPLLAVQRLHHSPLFRHVLRQDRRAPTQQSMQDFLSTLPSQRGNVGSLQPKGKCQV